MFGKCMGDHSVRYAKLKSFAVIFGSCRKPLLDQDLLWERSSRHSPCNEPIRLDFSGLSTERVKKTERPSGRASAGGNAVPESKKAKREFGDLSLNGRRMRY